MLLIAACNSEALPEAKDTKIDDINVTIERIVLTVKSTKVAPASHEAMARENIAQQIPDILTKANIKNVNKQGIDAIATLLEDDDDIVRLHAADALGFIGAPAKYTIPALRKALDKEIQEVACKTAPNGFCDFRTGWDSSDVIPEVIAKLNQ